MTKLTTVLIVVAIGLSILFVGEMSVQASPNSRKSFGQVVPKTKRVSRKVYRRGSSITKKTWNRTKHISKKVWRKSNRIGRKTAHKTKVFVMGPSKRKP